MVVDDEEFVTPLDLGIRWEPDANWPLLVQVVGTAYLVMAPHYDDDDRRLVILRFEHCDGAVLGSPNDEGRPGHRLWNQGLTDCTWAGEVHNSRWLREKRNPRWRHPRAKDGRYDNHRHLIIPDKEATFECLTTGVTFLRLDPPVSEAVAAIVESGRA